MNNDDKNVNQNNDNNYTKKTYAYIAIGLIAFGALAYGLSFTILGIYSLIASAIFEIAAMTFANLQARKNNLKWLIYVKIASYVVFAAALITMVGGTIWAAK